MELGRRICLNIKTYPIHGDCFLYSHYLNVNKQCKEISFSSLLGLKVVSFAAARAEVTQRSPSPRALRDDPKNGCEGD